MIDANIKKRFFDKVYKGDYCWEWTAALRNGYGVLKVNGKGLAAHRLSWLIYYGDIPNNTLVCHTCDNPKCVNPSHLFLGSHKDNSKDAYNKGRITIPEGYKFTINHYPNNTNIPKEMAIIIKQAVKNRGKKSLKQVSEEHGVPYQYVRDISSDRILKNFNP